jgi:uridylate kinase
LRRKPCLVIKLSGAALEEGDAMGCEYLLRFGEFVARISRRWKVALTVGGGARARQYIQVARDLGQSDARASLLGGDVGFINSRLLIAALAKVGVPTSLRPLKSWDRAETSLATSSVPVLFGHWPGLTSDSVAVFFGDYVSADLILKLSKIDAIYDSDPTRSSSAVALRQVSYEKLVELAMFADSRIAGSSFVVDVIAARRLASSGIPLFLASFKELGVVEGMLCDGDWTRAIEVARVGSLVGSGARGQR